MVGTKGKYIMPTICIDFDGTIANWAEYPEPGPPMEGVKAALQELKDMGFTLCIASSRTSDEINRHPIDKQVEIKRMEHYLEKYQIPYDIVLESDKVPATFYIDDRAIEFKNNWKEIIKRIKNDK